MLPPRHTRSNLWIPLTTSHRVPLTQHILLLYIISLYSHLKTIKRFCWTPSVMVSKTCLWMLTSSNHMAWEESPEWHSFARWVQWCHKSQNVLCMQSLVEMGQASFPKTGGSPMTAVLKGVSFFPWISSFPVTPCQFSGGHLETWVSFEVMLYNLLGVSV